MTPEIKPIDFYENHVKRAMISCYTHSCLRTSDPDAFTIVLARMFRLKKKMIRNIALYAKNDVEVKGHPLEDAVNNLAFFSLVFVDYLDKDNGQPIHKYYQSHE